MSAVAEYYANPTAENWHEVEFERECDNDYTPACICGNCRHCRSAEISAERKEFEDICVCEVFAQDDLRDAVILYTNKPADFNCEEWDW
jgi:hypothetical protein